MELEPIQYILAISGGFLAGIMNALAGFGSVITLAIMLDVIGLPPAIANGSNRVNVFAMASSSAFMYHKKGFLDVRRGKWYLITMIFGCIIGAFIAVNISNEDFKIVFKWLLVVLFCLVLLNPKKMMREVSIEDFKMPLYVLIPLFFTIGLYIGFIQMGGGLMVLMGLVLIGKYTIMDANALKLFTVAVQSVFVIGIFHYHGMINYQIGAIVAIGQVIGGLVTVNLAAKFPKINMYAYYALVVIMFLMLLKYFGFIVL